MVTSVLKVRGFTSKTGKGEAASPLDRAMNTILQKRRVDGAAPFLYHKGDIWESGGRKFLNTSSVRLLPAAPTSDAWGVKFPLIAQVYDNVFAQDRYRDIFLAWFKRFYESAEKGKIALGQALALVGPVHCYKSWTVHKIIKPSMGGFADLGNMANGSAGGFTADVFQSPIAVIDDDKGTSSEEKRRRYSATIKQLVAHGTHMYHKKFETPTEVEWRGRVILAINDDPISIRLLPDLNQSNEDKTIALTMKTWHDHPAPEVFDGLEDTELPHFLAWLKDWAPPEAILEPRSRYGVRSIIADEVREASFASSAVGSCMTRLQAPHRIAVPGDTQALASQAGQVRRTRVGARFGGGGTMTSLPSISRGNFAIGAGLNSRWTPAASSARWVSSIRSGGAGACRSIQGRVKPPSTNVRQAAI
jgi:hypothetical protein